MQAFLQGSIISDTDLPCGPETITEKRGMSFCPKRTMQCWNHRNYPRFQIYEV